MPSHARFVLLAMLAVVAAFAWRAAVLANAEMPEPSWLRHAVAFALCALGYAWFRLDSTARGYPRSLGLNVAAFLVGFVAIPLYLLRSREGEDRAQVLGQFVAFVFALFVALIAGSLLGSFLG